MQSLLVRALALSAFALSLPAASQDAAGAPPRSRELLRGLASRPRLAGTSGGRWGAEWVAERMRALGLAVEIETREVYLSLPRSTRLVARSSAGADDALIDRAQRYDPDAAEPGDVPLFHAWSASGRASGPVVHVGQGLRADYERLAKLGVDVRGAVALAQYGGAYRGVKVDLAAEHGCAGVLLYSPSSEDGAERGPVWPEGPWKPGGEAQRGSISPMGRAPGDPSTPEWPSPRPGEEGARLDASEFQESLPRIPSLPIGWDDARVLLERVSTRGGEAAAAPGDADESERLGPGPVVVELEVDAPVALRPIHNVVATLPGSGPELVLAGAHRDSWVRGAQDSGTGIVVLIRSAERLAERARAGWKPARGIAWCAWDAEEQGLIGSTEWAEARADELRERCRAYVNADACVSGTSFRASGTPGMVAPLRRAAERIRAVAGERSLWDEWAGGARGPSLGLPGSGSDFAVFVHHLGLPCLDLGFSGNSGGQYHTSFDDFELVDRFLDPGFAGHEKAAELMAELLVELARTDAPAFDASEAAAEIARHARLAGHTALGSSERGSSASSWLGAARAERLAAAFDRLAAAARAPSSPGAAAAPAPGADLSGPRFYRAFQIADGLDDRSWFRNALWAPGLETGYSSETFPTLRAAARRGEKELERELAALIARADTLARELAPASEGTDPAAGAGGR